MFGGNVFVPKPMMWPGVSIPPGELHLDFYNRNVTEIGRENWESFLSTFGKVIYYISEQERSEINAQINAFNIPEGEELPFNLDGNTYFLDLSASDQTLLEDLLGAHDFRQESQNAHAELGVNLENWDLHLGQSGAYDSQLMFPFLTAYNNLSVSIPAEVISRVNLYIDTLSNEEVEELCNRLDVSIDDGDYQKARIDLQDFMSRTPEELSSLPQFNSDSTSEKEMAVKGKAVEPAVGMVAMDMGARRIAHIQEENYRSEVRRAEDFEREDKMAQLKDAAKKRAENKRMMKKEMAAKISPKRNEKVKNQRRGRA